MFELKNIEGNVLIKANISGYQFPDSMEDDWCLLSITIKQGPLLFEKIDPALEAKEIVEIHNWFNALASYSLPRYSTLTFVEPCISFDYLAYREGKVRFSIILSHELKPRFELEQFNRSNPEWVIVFELDRVELRVALEGLKNTIEKYTVRERS